MQASDSTLTQEHKNFSQNKKRRGVAGLPLSRATTPCCIISTNDPRPNWDVSVRLILMQLESGSFDSENKRRISKIPVAPNHSVRGYVSSNIDYWNGNYCKNRP